MDNSGEQLDCLLKDVDWRNNPTKIEYRLSREGPIREAFIDEIQEFAIANSTKYIRQTVDVDRSSDLLDLLDSKRTPSFSSEQIFLKVLLEGAVSLFEYSDGQLRRFFYTVSDEDVKPLIHKIYKKSLTDIGENNTFRQQLINEVNCSSMSTKSIEKLDYKKSELVKHFMNYHRCKDLNFQLFEENEGRDLINFHLRPGVNLSSLAVINTESALGILNSELNNRFGYRLGFEFEFILPFRKNTWSLFIEPTFHFLKTDKTVETNMVSGGVLLTSLNYKSIEIPFGFRHYVFLKNQSKIFLNAALIFDVNTNSTIDYSRADGSNIVTFDIESKPNFGLGAGYWYKDRFCLELRYQTSRDVLNYLIFVDSSYKSLSVIFGYPLI